MMQLSLSILPGAKLDRVAGYYQNNPAITPAAVQDVICDLSCR
jgi:hypothetical protein